jgi:DsbC/DsbD-like thiol-disulfide interchange protein
MSNLLCRSLRFVCLIAGIALASAESASAQQQDGKVLVTASLISDTGSIQPGQKFRIGVLYRIEPDWHIYWKYPGDAGIAIKIAWQLPEGFKVHDLQWPIPTREKEPGDLEVFAYSSEVLLFVEVEAPESLSSGPIEIQAKSDWLVCENFCIPGSAQLSLRMNAGVNASSRSAPIFERYAAQLPKTLPAELKIGFGRTGNSLGLTIAGVPNGSVLSILWDYTSPYYSWGILASGGGYIFGKTTDGYDPRNVGVATDGAVQALSELVHLIDIGVLPRMASSGDMPQELMAQGKLAMMISGPWDWPNLMKSGIDFGVAPMPGINGKLGKAFIGVQVVFVNRSSPNRDLVKDSWRNMPSPRKPCARWIMSSRLEFPR